MPYRFSDHVLDLHTGTLEGPRGVIHLRPKTFDLLSVLLRRGGCVVSKDELLAIVWESAHLSDDTLAQAVSELRRALGDNPRQPRFIETVHRRGYRFICPVEAQAYRSRPTDPEATRPVDPPLPEPQAPEAAASAAKTPAERPSAGLRWLRALAPDSLTGKGLWGFRVS